MEEDYTLDTLGNWSGYVTKTAGTTDLNQSRTNNDVNEITNITETTGPSWATPAHDAAGNMTTIPQPGDLTSSYVATYDAWNRLVKLVDGANTVAEYEYDGLNRRIVKSIYSAGTLDHKQRFYYNQQWQALEVRKEFSGTEDPDPLEQYVYHPYYIDSVLLRDYDANTDGTSVRHYYMHDGNFSVTAITDDSGTVLERYHYTPYGENRVLDADFSSDADGVSDFANPVTFTGRRFDAETGLDYFRNRYYHTGIGRFISRDAMLYIDGNNLYAAYFIPNAVDPLGLYCCTEAKKKAELVSYNICVANVTEQTAMILGRAYEKYQIVVTEVARQIASALAVCTRQFGPGSAFARRWGGTIAANALFACQAPIYIVYGAERASMLAAYNALTILIRAEHLVRIVACRNGKPCAFPPREDSSWPPPNL